MPVGVTADAAAIALPRSRTSTIACSPVMTWVAAAAVISPTEWPGARADDAERVGGVREELEQRHHAGGHEQRLGHGGVADGLRVGLGAVVDEIHAGDGGQPGQAVPRIRAARARGTGNRGSGRLGPERR